jgi:hypothetical protein
MNIVVLDEADGMEYKTNVREALAMLVAGSFAAPLPRKRIFNSKEETNLVQWGGLWRRNMAVGLGAATVATAAAIWEAPVQ